MEMMTMINWEICEKCPHEDECQIFNPEDCKRYRTLDSSLSKIDKLMIDKFIGEKEKTQE